MIAAAGAGMPAVEHIFVGTETALMRVVVNGLGDIDGFAPGFRGLNIDFNDAGIGRDFENIKPRIGRRRVAFDMDRQIEFGSRRLDGRDQFQIIVERFSRRHEDADMAVAYFHRHRRAHRIIRAAARLRRQTLQHQSAGRKRR